MRSVRMAVGLVAVLMAAACSGERADPQSKAIVEAREQARERFSAPGGLAELSRVELDYCREGQYDWDGSDETIGRIPASLYKRDGDLRRLWIVFQSTASPPPDPYFYPHLGTADQVDSEKHFSTHYSTTTGTPWGTAWESASRPGPYLVVFKSEDVYHRQPR